MSIHRDRGFALIEMAIALVIIGLALGTALRAQELVSLARVRNIAMQLDGVRIAYLGFKDRYGAYPGDMTTARANAMIPGNPGGCTGGAGCANGQIDPDERYVVWAQLSYAGFIIGSYSGGISDTKPTSVNSPRNPFGGYLALVSDAKYDDALDPAQMAKLNVKTGGAIPAVVLAEIDRKLDDGAPLTGTFRSAGYGAATAYDSIVKCTLGPAAQASPTAHTHATIHWDSASNAGNCGGVALQ